MPLADVLGVDPVVLVLFGLPLCLLFAWIVRWWWTHEVLEELGRIRAAIDRLAPPPPPPAPPPLPGEPEPPYAPAPGRSLTVFTVFAILMVAAFLFIGRCAH